jgi:hypothetical protein
MVPRPPQPPPRRDRPTLAERSAAAGVPGAAELVAELGAVQPLAPGRAGPPERSERSPERWRPKHCWVSDPRWPGRRPALLLAWQWDEHGWRGRVAIPTGDDAGVALAWVAADRLVEA